MKKPISYYFGNLLILLSLLGFLYLGIPVLSAYLFPSQPPQPTNSDYILWVPKIKAAGKIIPQVDPWNEKVYKDALHHGIAEAKGFAQPGQQGTMFLFAHSSGMPWEQTRYNTVFLRLGELSKDDAIIIWKDGKKYTYLVTGSKEVFPEEVSIVTKAKNDQLILQTCTPIGTDWKRLLVFASEIKE